MEVIAGLKLDPPTLLFSISLMSFMMGAVAHSLALSEPLGESGLKEWGWAMVMAGLGFVLYHFRGMAPWFLSFVLANALVLTFPVLAVKAHCKLVGSRVPRLALTISWLIGFSGVLTHEWLDTHLRFAAASMSFGVAGMMLTMLLAVSHDRVQRREPSGWLMMAMMALGMLAFASRAVVGLSGDLADVGMTASSRQHITALLIGAVFNVGASLGFFFMVQERLRRHALEQSRRDMLTGLYTRAGFFELAERLDQVPGDQGFAIVMLDIDHFKLVNDTHGHAGGDVTLAHVARLIANSVRISDLACRYGGEEFCLLLRGCSEAEATQFAARLVEEAERQFVCLRNGGQVQYTLSAGHACRRPSARAPSGLESVEDVIERADRALYEAKAAGRNRAMPAGALA